MQKFFILIIPVILFSQPPQNAIFGAKIKGIKIKEFEPPASVKFVKFRCYQSGEWWILKAKAEIDGGYLEGDIIEIKLKGIKLDSMLSDLPVGEYFYGFSESGPDVNGYVTLNVLTTAGNSYPILKTKLKGTKVNGYQVVGNHISRFYIQGPDPDGYVWLLADIGQVGVGERRPVIKGKDKSKIKVTNNLEKIAPNPAREFTRIYYSIAKDSHIKIYAYDKRGRLIKKIVDKYQPRGIYRFFWGLDNENGNLIPAGEYFIKMEAGKFKEIKKILILK
ncbi:MAG: hypothetical protein ABIM62_06710 [candidate division WOR-3 bacterium]